MTRNEAVALVQRIMDADYDCETQAAQWLEMLGRALGCPAGYVSNLIFWPAGANPTAADIVNQALAYQPIAL